MSEARLIGGDCLERLRELPSDSLDAVVTDPPYGLGEVKDLPGLLAAWATESDERDFIGKAGFMGKDWDAGVPAPRYWREVLRVMKPGAHALIFGGTRTFDLLSVSLRLAGFEMRDTISNEGVLRWYYGSGFPKSLNVGKSLSSLYDQKQRAHGRIPKEGTETMRRYAGLGTALKPSWEPIVVTRKPLEAKNVAANVLRHGTGAINVASTRVKSSDNVTFDREAGNRSREQYRTGTVKGSQIPTSAGRWPSNLLLSHSGGCVRVGTKRVRGNGSARHNTAEAHNRTNSMGKSSGDWTTYGYADPDGYEETEAWECVEGCPILEMGRQSGFSKSPKTYTRGTPGYNRNAYASGVGEKEGTESINHGDQGSASRFYPNFPAEPGFLYAPKASRRERNEGLEGMPTQHIRRMSGGEYAHNSGSKASSKNGAYSQNHHPTVKPLAVMRWLVKLVTPPGGTVLDPFMGSGTTGCAAMLLGVDFVGIEKDGDYLEIAKQRIEHHKQAHEGRLFGDE